MSSSIISSSSGGEGVMAAIISCGGGGEGGDLVRRFGRGGPPAGASHSAGGCARAMAPWRAHDNAQGGSKLPSGGTDTTFNAVHALRAHLLSAWHAVHHTSRDQKASAH